MTPQVYCARLERALSLMPAAERQETIRYYLEFLEDASEEERAALGTPEALAQQILRENGISPQPAVIKHSNRTARLLIPCTSTRRFRTVTPFTRYSHSGRPSSANRFR